MGETHVFQCDGPTCIETDEESWDHAALREAGWQVFDFIAYVDDDGDELDEPTECVSFFCSFRCLAMWAEEKAE